MQMSEWQIWYEKILNDFNFSLKDDEDSAIILSKLLDGISFLKINDLIDTFESYDKAIVFGAGPSLLKHIQIIKNCQDLEDYILIAADGASSALLSENLVPDIIVTDLDGKLEDLYKANKKGSIMVIHAHGNNSNEISEHTLKFNNILGTTQSKPIKNLYNFGGFTDGDRAIFLAVDLNVSEIVLAGMDFGNIVTKFSRPNILNDTEIADDIKIKKLKYAECLTQWIVDNENIKIKKLK
ncbi:6-hydroxymethylpterin diphosphokinase MptE-like protein [Methanobrevibacter sp. DSM 116169]|uniref:6-hydroxymethylpterin diphosphokinase MptE-like protein n=1 Tax=Methanobrevibacter sp. DSM 116169 TaxID=3242727 RepID=UPI0038FBF449